MNQPINMWPSIPINKCGKKENTKGLRDCI